MTNRFTYCFFLRRSVVLLLVLTSYMAVGQSKDFVFSAPFSGTHNISSYLMVWPDTAGQHGIEDLVSSKKGAFTSIGDLGFVPDFPAVIWLKIRLTNQGKFDVPAAFTFSPFADSIELYAVKNNVVTYKSTTGNAYTPAHKPVPSVRNNLEIYMPAQQTHTYYIRQTFLHPVAANYLSELYIKDPAEMTAELMFRYAGQAFYAGLMLMFALLSFFGWLLIRDRSFFYFSLVHLAFALYFLATKNVFGVLVFNMPEFSVFNIQDISISLLIASIFIFIAHYLKLRHLKPLLYRIMLFITVVVVLNKYLLGVFLDSQICLGTVNNAFILLWIVAIVLTIIILALKRISEAVNLLISLSILVVTAGIYLFAMSMIIPQNFFTMHSIQIGSVLFALLVFFRLFQEVKSIESEKQRAMTISDLKSKFFTNVSHELRTPLTLILSPLEKLDEIVEDSKQQQLIQLATKHANRLLHLINQLLNIARLEEGEVKLSVQKTDVVPFAKGILMSFESLAEKKEIALNFVSNSKEVSLWLDTEKMEVILYNLLSNALKHTPAGGSVAVEVIESDEVVQVLVKDTGVGIPEDLLPYLFDRFFRVENTGADGNGVGLCLTNELTRLHQGTIEVQSKVGEGSVFTLAFKKGNSHFSATELAGSEGEKKLSTGADSLRLHDEHTTQDLPMAVFPSTAHGTRPSVLLVEDNSDMRSYIRSQLIDRFEILEAVNGRVGYEMAVETMPDLIISDVMMPEMNGIDLCNLIKKDVRTSHIPVILLTAKSEQEDRLEGLEAGADGYLPKPFNVKELNVRIQNLIEQRIRLRNRLMEEPTLSFKPLEGSPVENQFIQQITTCIHNQLADSQFSVVMLAEHVKLSVQQLNRKLRAITGLTASKYVQSIRLKKALEILQTEDVNVAEAAHKTGFSSTAYFVKSFREHFGKTPGSLLRRE